MSHRQEVVRSALLAALCPVIALTTSTPALAQCEVAQLAGSNVPGEERFEAVSMDGDVVVIGTLASAGSHTGTAYVFRHGGLDWIEEALLRGDDTVMGDLFGWSVSAYGDRVVVGAAGDDDGENSAGAAYVFWYNGSSWEQEAKLTAQVPVYAGELGRSVAISGDRVIAGAPGPDEFAAVYHRVGATWTQEATLTASDGDPFSDQFGISVAISGDYAVVGAPGHLGVALPAGAAYMFRFNGASWVETQKLIGSDTDDSDSFGAALALDADRLVVGGKEQAYVFERVGTDWVEQAILTTDDGTSLGASFDIDGDVIVAGVPDFDGEQSRNGVVYVFRRVGSEWLQETQFVPSDPVVQDELGTTVSVVQPYVVGGIGRFGRPVRVFSLTSDCLDAECSADPACWGACCTGPSLCQDDVSILDCVTGSGSHLGPSTVCYLSESSAALCADGLDNDCDGLIDCDDPDCCVDNDGDTYGVGPCCAEQDCDDDDFNVNPGVDADTDGWNACDDCDETNNAVNPGAAEVCDDLIDNDCDTQSDCDDPDCVWDQACCSDNDGDRYGEGPTCLGPDCDDTRIDINPGASEVCDDLIDNDCDTKSDCADYDCAMDPGCQGACCLQDFDGTCLEALTANACAAAQGIYQGDETTCGQLVCPAPPGACCEAGGGCSELTRLECAAIGSSGWAGPDTTCADSFDPVEVLGSSCSDSFDNDCDGFTDCEDPNCGSTCTIFEATPLTAPYPHDRRKNRYMSFDPIKIVNDGNNIAFKVELKSIYMGSCDDGTGAQGGKVDFCRIDRGANDCNACSGAGASCITASVDCPPGESCNSTGATCVNDAPNSGGSNVGRVWWVGPEHPANNSVHLMVSEPFRKISTDWPNPTHVGDCEIVPRAVYGVRAVDTATSAESDELVVETTRFPAWSPPAPFWWGDCVGELRFRCNGDIREPTCLDSADCAGNPCLRAWELPNGVVGFDDITAALWTMAPRAGVTVSADITWVDLYGNGSFLPGSQTYDPPDYQINVSDLQQSNLGFGGSPYKGYDPADCPDEPDWP